MSTNFYLFPMTSIKEIIGIQGWTSSGIQQTTHIVKEGEPIGNFYGWKAVGLTDDGLWLVEGADGNPKLASEAGQEDKQVIGNGLPSMYAGLNTTLLYKKSLIWEYL